MIELESLDTTTFATKGGRLVVRHPVSRKPLADEEGNEAYLIIAGADSEQATAVDRAISNRRIEARMLTVSGIDIDHERMEKLVACTLEVGHMTLGGVAITADDPKTVRQMYDRLKWLREDAEKFLMDRANFLPGPETV